MGKKKNEKEQMKKIAIACPGQVGDICTALSALRFKDELWPDAEITWLSDDRYYDIFKHNPYLKVQQFPHGWQISEHDKQTIYAERIAKDKAEGKPIWEDLSFAVNKNNMLNHSVKNRFESIKNFDEVYFPAPHQLSGEQRSGVNYPNCSKRVFGVPDHYEWHPVLYHTPEEQVAIDSFMKSLPSGKVILIESYCGSQQSKITHEMITETMKMCEWTWGLCNFVFVSHKYLNAQPDFPETLFKGNVVSAAHFTVRQCSLMINYADLMISTSSGVTCAVSAWGRKPTTILQYCGSAICGTKELANGEMIQVFTDDNPKAEEQYFTALRELLTKYK